MRALELSLNADIGAIPPSANILDDSRGGQIGNRWLALPAPRATTLYWQEHGLLGWG
jgi:hypothetical protein